MMENSSEQRPVDPGRRHEHDINDPAQKDALARAIHTSERVALVGASAMLSVFFLAAMYAAFGEGITVPGCVTDRRPFTEGRLLVPADRGNRFELQAVARMWQFDPGVVVLPRGAVVDIYLSAADVAHGYYIQGKNVNLMAIPGAVNYARTRFDQEGSYAVVCHEYCGQAHHIMQGEIRVVSRKEFWRLQDSAQTASAGAPSGATLGSIDGAGGESR